MLMEYVRLVCKEWFSCNSTPFFYSRKYTEQSEQSSTVIQITSKLFKLYKQAENRGMTTNSLLPFSQLLKKKKKKLQ
jgi:hypothetical protein